MVLINQRTVLSDTNMINKNSLKLLIMFVSDNNSDAGNFFYYKRVC